MDKTSIQEHLRSLSPETLKKAFIEIEKWDKSGILEEGVVRTAFHMIYGSNSNVPLFAISHVFAMEMARRWVTGYSPISEQPVEKEDPKKISRKSVFIYVRGVCTTSVSKKPGKYIAIIRDSHGNQIEKICGSDIHTTSNRMIITGLSKAIQFLKTPSQIQFYTHCAIGLKSSKTNKDLILRLQELLSQGNHCLQEHISQACQDTLQKYLDSSK